MPRLSKAVPRYRKHRASKQAVVTLNGRDYYLGPHGSKASRLEYDRLIGEWLAGGRRLVDESAADETTIGEICVDYTRQAKVHYQKNGELTREYGNAQRVMKELRQLYGKTLAIEFGPIKFKAFRQRYIDKELARQTINHYLIHVIKAFRLAAENEKLPASVYQNLKAVERLKIGRSAAPEGGKVYAVELAIVESTLPHLLPIVADMVRLHTLTGMRPNEVCVIRPFDIDRSRDVWVYVPESHKTEHHSKRRLIHIGPEGQTVLQPYLLRDEMAYCFSPAEAVEQQRLERSLNRKTPISCGNRIGTNRKRKPSRNPADHYSIDSYRKAIYRACEKAEIECWSPGQVRHLTATTIRKECSLEAAQIILGHSSKTTTEKWYAEPHIEAAVEVMRKMG